MISKKDFIVFNPKWLLVTGIFKYLNKRLTPFRCQDKRKQTAREQQLKKLLPKKKGKVAKPKMRTMKRKIRSLSDGYYILVKVFFFK